MIIVGNADVARSAAICCDWSDITCDTCLIRFIGLTERRRKLCTAPFLASSTPTSRHGARNTRSRALCAACGQQEINCYYRDRDGGSRKVDLRAEDKFVSTLARSAIAAIRPRSRSCRVEHTIRLTSTSGTQSIRGRELCFPTRLLPFWDRSTPRFPIAPPFFPFAFPVLCLFPALLRLSSNAVLAYESVLQAACPLSKSTASHPAQSPPPHRRPAPSSTLLLREQVDRALGDVDSDARHPPSCGEAIDPPRPLRCPQVGAHSAQQIPVSTNMIFEPK